jgi:hypothetical protein
MDQQQLMEIFNGGESQGASAPDGTGEDETLFTTTTEEEQ